MGVEVGLLLVRAVEGEKEAKEVGIGLQVWQEQGCVAGTRVRGGNKGFYFGRRCMGVTASIVIFGTRRVRAGGESEEKKERSNYKGHMTCTW